MLLLPLQKFRLLLPVSEAMVVFSALLAEDSDPSFPLVVKPL
jgi:hypothetical protein